MPQPDGADMSHRASANEEHADQSQALNPPNPFVPTFGEGPGMQAAPVQGNEISREAILLRLVDCYSPSRRTLS